MKYFIKIMKFIINSITTVIIVLGLIFITLFVFGIQPFVVESGSMEPTVLTGSVCFINKRAKYDDMRVGDIIAFKINENACATHRIVEINDEGFVTKGDNNSNVDAIITKRDTFLGKNVFSIPKVGFLVKVIQTTSGKIIVVTIIIVLLLAGLLLGEPTEEKSKKVKEKHKKE